MRKTVRSTEQDLDKENCNSAEASEMKKAQKMAEQKEEASDYH